MGIGGFIEGFKGSLMPIEDVFALAGNDLDSGLPVGETDEGKDTGFVDCRLRPLRIRQAVGNSDMTVALGIDACHLMTKEPAMRRSVAELVDGDVIMNHLMEDGVLNEFFRQVNTGIDTQDEVLVAVSGKQALSTSSESHLAEEPLGMAESNRDGRKRTAEETGIILVKTGLDV